MWNADFSMFPRWEWGIVKKMNFPPPARLLIPLLVLVFGLAVTWFDYALNLAGDLNRNLIEVREQADATGGLLAKLGAPLMGPSGLKLLRAELAASDAQPWLDTAAVVDEAGRILVDSDGLWEGQEAHRTRLAPAAQLIKQGAGPGWLHSDDRSRVYGAYPVEGQRAWVLVAFDRTKAITRARTDAGRQVRWVAAAVAVLCGLLWAGLHWGFAQRIARLTGMVRSFSSGDRSAMRPLRGGDEVAHLSVAFAAMAARVQAQETERVQLEGEVLEASERERRRIGHELHDGLGQRLTAASLALNALQDLDPEHTARVAEIGRSLRGAIAETRHLSHGLAPVQLEANGLMDALAEMAESTGREGAVRVVFECPEPILIAKPQAGIHLFRIAQEAVNNALKHATPGEIRIGLERRGGELQLEVEDDGVGLPEPLRPGAGIGLRVMRHRAELLGGMLEIGASPAGGTLVRCRCPLVEVSV